MEKSACSRAWGRIRTSMLTAAAAIVAVAQGGVASAMAPAPMLQASPSPTPVLSDVSVTVTSPFNADVTATVISNGGTPPINARGFVFAPTSVSSDPQYGVDTAIPVPGTLGSMTRTLNLSPGTNYSVKAYAQNPAGVGYSAVATFDTPCPLITLSGLPNSTLGANYNGYVYASGGSGGYFMQVVSGTLPPGMLFYPGDYQTWGLLSGQPTAVGTYNFSIGVMDAYWGTCAGIQAYSITIDAIDVSPRKIPFASEVVGVTSPPRAITVINSDPVNSISLGALSPSLAEFAVSSTDCPDPVPASSYCTINVTYTPSAASPSSGTLAVGPVTVSLAGTGTTTTPAQVYVSDNSSGSVSVIDPVSNVVRTSVYSGSGPFALAALPGGGKVYVPNQSSNSVNRILTSDYSNLESPILVGAAPTAVAATPSGDEVWVVNRDSSDISIIDPATDSVTSTITLSAGCLWGPQGIVANPANHDMYAISTYGGRVCVFDRLTHAFVRSIDVGQGSNNGPTNAVVSPDGSRLYVNTSSSKAVVKIDLATDTVTPMGAEAYVMDIKADGSKIYLSTVSNQFGYLDTASGNFTAIPLTGVTVPFGVAVDDAADRVYVSDTYNNSVYVVRLSTNTEIANPGLPITDSSLSVPIAIAVIKPNVAPTGVVPTVDSLVITYPIPPNAFSVSLDANVSDDGGLPIFERGFAYAPSPIDPVPGASPFVKTVPVSGSTGPMSASILSLLGENTTYNVRAYAKNFVGTGLSPADSFTTATLGCSEGVYPGLSFLPGGVLNVPYAGATLTALQGPATFAITAGALPPGLTLSGDTISGTPTATGYYSVAILMTVTATGCIGFVNYDLTIGTPVAAGDVVISEFRARGVGGALDEYVELANRTSSDIVVAAADGSGGWSIGTAGGLIGLISDGTVIEKGSRFLLTGWDFSLYDFGYPDWVYWGDADLDDIPDDGGIGLFTTADSGNYSASTALDAAGGAAETNPLFYEGPTPLVAVVQVDAVPAPVNPPAQTAWVRRTGSDGALADTGDNTKDFIFVATDAGTNYGPAGNVAAVLGAPSPEDSYAVREVLNAQLPMTLVDPSRGQDQFPNRMVQPYYAIEYRRTFTNNTGSDIGSLAFKIINLTTINSGRTVAPLQQAQLGVVSSNSVTLEVPVGSNNFIDAAAVQLDYPWMYNTFCCWLGGMNSRVLVPFGGGLQLGLRGFQSFSSGSTFIHPGEKISVNFRAQIWTTGYYIWVIMPEVSPTPAPQGCSDCALLKSGLRSDRRSERPPRQRR